MKHPRITLVLTVISCVSLILLVSRNSLGRTTDEKSPKVVPKSERIPVSMVSVRKAKCAPDPVAESRAYKKPLIRFIGNGTSGKVVGPDGRTLMASGEGIGIFGASVAADQKQVLIKGGSGVNFVMNSVTGDKVQLPLTPPGQDMMGFETWYWINNKKLLGVSGVEAHDAEAKAVGYCPEPHPSRTKLYIYDVPAKQLSEVAFPADDPGPVFSVTEVSHDGAVHIFGDGLKEGTPPDLGWFQMD